MGDGTGDVKRRAATRLPGDGRKRRVGGQFAMCRAEQDAQCAVCVRRSGCSLLSDGRLDTSCVNAISRGRECRQCKGAKSGAYKCFQFKRPIGMG